MTPDHDTLTAVPSVATAKAAPAAAPADNVVELPCALKKQQAAPRSIDAASLLRYEAHLAEILDALGMDLDTPGTRNTPERLLKALIDSTAGYEGDPKLSTIFPAETSGAKPAAAGQIVEGPISFVALCEHHALPFHGHASIGYVASDQIIGISKLTRLVRLYARRFTVQERLGEQIADTLEELVAPQGVAVYLEASHMCTQMRGVEEESRTTTTFWRGLYEDPALRNEFLQLVRC